MGRIKARCLWIALYLSALVLWAGHGLAQQTSADRNTTAEQDVQMVKSLQDVPQEVMKEGKIPVMVMYQDMDSLGRRMVFQLRERLNGSDLFRLSGYKERKIKIFVSSQEEFQGRPGLSSIYTLVWTYSYGEDVLSNYLDHQVGIVKSNAIQDLVETLVARTDEICMQFSYLFEEE